jgi:hypothetical protein
MYVIVIIIALLSFSRIDYSLLSLSNSRDDDPVCMFQWFCWDHCFCIIVLVALLPLLLEWWVPPNMLRGSKCVKLVSNVFPPPKPIPIPPPPPLLFLLLLLWLLLNPPHEDGEEEEADDGGGVIVIVTFNGRGVIVGVLPPPEEEEEEVGDDTGETTMVG